jgi:flagellar basal body rod protein FlgC
MPPSIRTTDFPKDSRLMRDQSTPESPDYTAPENRGFGRALANVDAGVPGSARGMTKLGKLLTILRGVGTGAIIGSGQSDFSSGFQATQQNENQQREFQSRQAERQLEVEQARQNLAYMPLQREWQRQQMELSQALTKAKTAEANQLAQTNEAREENQRRLAARPDTIKLKDGSVLQKDPNNPNADENGYVEIAPAAPTKQKELTPEQESYQSAVEGYKKQGLNDQQIYQRMHPHEWQQGAGAGGGAAAAPMATPQHLQERLAAMSPEVRGAMQHFQPNVQEALIALANGDIPASTWSSRGAYKNLGGLTQGQAVGWARSINPNWNATLYPVKQNANKNYTDSKKEGGQLEAFSNFLNHAGDAAEVTAKWRDKFAVNGSPWINTPMNKLRNKLAGDPDYTAFVAALEPVKKEYMSFLNANRAEHQQDLETMDKILNPDSTPAQIEGALKQLGRTAVLRLDSLDQNYRTAAGGQRFPNLITPKAKQAAAKLGFGNDVEPYGSGGVLSGYSQAAASQAPAAPAAPTPRTHDWSATAWQQAHPGQDVRAAIAEAKRQGFNVSP